MKLLWVLGLSGVLAGCGSSSPSHSPDAGADATPPPPCAPFDMTMSPLVNPGPVLWTGTEYLVPVQSQPVVMQPIAADGTKGATFSLGISFDGFGFPLVWTGTQLAALSVTTGTTGSIDFVLSRFAADGTPLGTSTIGTRGGLVNELDYRQLHWVGDHYVAGWIDQTASTATVEEVSADGTPGGIHVLHSRSPDVGGVSFNALVEMTSTPATLLVGITFGSAYPTLVTIDRTTGAMAHYMSNTLASEVVPRATDFVRYELAASQPNDMQAPALVVIDAQAKPTPLAILPPVNSAVDLVATSSGYRLSSITNDQMAGTAAIDKLDIAPDGTALGTVTQIATAPSDMSFGLPGATSRGNGVLTFFEYGPNSAWTQRLIQECSP